jgi:hypothetical protein
MRRIRNEETCRPAVARSPPKLRCQPLRSLSYHAESMADDQDSGMIIPHVEHAAAPSTAQARRAATLQYATLPNSQHLALSFSRCRGECPWAPRVSRPHENLSRHSSHRGVCAGSAVAPRPAGSSTRLARQAATSASSLEEVCRPRDGTQCVHLGGWRRVW